MEWGGGLKGGEDGGRRYQASAAQDASSRARSAHKAVGSRARRDVDAGIAAARLVASGPARSVDRVPGGAGRNSTGAPKR